MIHLVTGGARADKSRFVLTEAESTGAPSLAFVATAQALDDEMAVRIRHHRAERGPRWVTFEEPLRIASLLPRLTQGGVVVDCLTLWIANLVFSQQEPDDAPIHSAIDALVGALDAMRAPIWFVTNEVGLGIVPGDALSRRYRDLLGRCNQRLAARADRVTMLVSGLPLQLK